MREISVDRIKEAVRELCLKANFELRKDILKAVRQAAGRETNVRARNALKSIIENARIARAKKLAICQDTGMVVVHIKIGQEVRFFGGDVEKAINDGVKEAYVGGCLRKSVVGDPILRSNTNTNTPCFVFADLVGGDRVKIEVSPKGFGSENKSRIKMFRPTDTVEDIKNFVLDVVREAGPDACPPLVLGIGIGGTMDVAAYMAKKALFRSIDVRNPKRHLSKMEREILHQANALGVGPMGLGGKTTVLGVNILEAPAHIAGLPVAVNVSCHATRSAEKTL